MACLIYALWNSHQAQRVANAARKQYTRLISAPSPSTSVIPSSTPVRTVTVTQVSVEESHFTLTSWLSPPSATATITPAFAPSDIPEPIAAEDLPLIKGLIIILWIVVIIGVPRYLLKLAKGTQHPIDHPIDHPPEEASLSCSESTETYDLHDLDIVWYLAVEKIESDARELYLKAIITEISKENHRLTARVRFHEGMDRQTARGSEVPGVHTTWQGLANGHIGYFSADFLGGGARPGSNLLTTSGPAVTMHQIPANSLALTSAQPTAQTSHQDVTLDNAGDQIPPPPAATESPITEAEEASSSENGTEQSPITEAEKASPSENGTEQVEDEEPLTGTPAFEPSSLGEGAAQIPQDQEKEAAPSAPVPSEEPAASPQLTEPEAALGPATSDDGASEAPVATEIAPGEPIGDREPEEPTAGAVSDEVPGTTPNDDGVPMAPLTNETEPDEPVVDEPEGHTAVESDQLPIFLADAPELDGFPSGHETHDIAPPSESLATEPPSYEPSYGVTEDQGAQNAEVPNETPLLDDDVEMFDEVLFEDLDMDGQGSSNETSLAPPTNPHGESSAAFDPDVFLAELANETPLDLETGTFGPDSVFYDPTGVANETQQGFGTGTFGQGSAVHDPSYCPSSVANEMLRDLRTGTFGQGSAGYNPSYSPAGVTNETQQGFGTGTFGQGGAGYNLSYYPTGLTSGTQPHRNMYLGQGVDAIKPGLLNEGVPSEMMVQLQSMGVGGLSSVPRSTVPGDSTAAVETLGDLDMDHDSRNAGANEPDPVSRDVASEMLVDLDMDRDDQRAGANEPGPLRKDFASETMQPQSIDLGGHGSIPSDTVPQDTADAIERQPLVDTDMDGDDMDEDESDEDDTMEKELAERLFVELEPTRIPGRKILAPRGRLDRLSAAQQAQLLADQAEAHAALPSDPEHDSDLDSEPETPQVRRQKIPGAGGVPRDVPQARPSTAPQVTPQLPQPPAQTGSWKTAYEGSPDNPLYGSDTPSLEVAAETIQEWVRAANKQFPGLMRTEEFLLREMASEPKSDLGKIIDRMAWIAEFLEHGREDWSLLGLLDNIIPDVGRTAAWYKSLGGQKKSEDLVKPMLKDVARIGAKLENLKLGKAS